VLPLTPRAFEERTTRVERASPEWRSGALPSELRPPNGTPGWIQTSGLCRRRAALSSLSYGRGKEPPAGVEPALRPYKGRVLPLTLRRREWRRRESNPLLLVASEVLFLLSYIPRCGRMESNHQSARRRGYGPLSSPMLGVRVRGDQPGSNRYREAHNLGCLPFTPWPPRERGRPDSNRRPLA
jgi:hypothetical protein